MLLTALVRRTLLLALLAPLGLLRVALGIAALCGRVHLVLGLVAVEDGADRLFARGEVGRYVEQLVLAGGRIPSQLAHEIPARGAQMKGTSDFGVLDAGELGALLGEATDVIPQRLIGLLSAPLKIPRVPRAHVHALKVSHENLDQITQLWIWLAGRCSSQVRAGSARCWGGLRMMTASSVAPPSWHARR